jgi:hypothetical protein
MIYSLAFAARNRDAAKAAWARGLQVGLFESPSRPLILRDGPNLRPSHTGSRIGEPPFNAGKRCLSLPLRTAEAAFEE